MKRVVWFAPAVLSVWTVIATAEDKIYESTGQGGVPQFSDLPTPGSQEITLPPPNVIDTTQPEQPPAPAPQEVLSGYSQLAIVIPAEQDTMHTNTGAFDVKVAVQPALNPGDAFMVTLDGTALPGRYGSADIAISAEDFASAASEDVQHRLEVAVVDSGGNVRITAGPVSFYVHRATVRRQQ